MAKAQLAVISRDASHRLGQMINQQITVVAGSEPQPRALRSMPSWVAAVVILLFPSLRPNS